MKIGRAGKNQARDHIDSAQQQPVDQPVTNAARPGQGKTVHDMGGRIPRSGGGKQSLPIFWRWRQKVKVFVFKAEIWVYFAGATANDVRRICMIVFLHIPKTAGTTFQFILENSLGMAHCHLGHLGKIFVDQRDLDFTRKLFPWLPALPVKT